MKKIKKTIKKMPKKIVALIMTLTLVFTCITSVTRVIADDHGSGDYSMNLGIVNTLGATVGDVTVNSYSWGGQGDMFFNDTDTFHITVELTTEGGVTPKLQWGGNMSSYISNYSRRFLGSTYTISLDFTVPSTDQIFLGLEVLEDEPSHTGERFDGKAYVVWSCGNGTCYHYFDNIPNFDDGNSTFYSTSEVTADNDTSIEFDVDADRIGWVLKDDFDRWTTKYKDKYGLNTINWSTVNPMDIIGEPNQNMGQWEEDAVAHGCERPTEDAGWQEQKAFTVCVDDYAYSVSGMLPFVKLQPLNEPSYNNAHVSYGDRNFKVVIYNEDYKGVAMGNLNSLNYYPSSWTNPFVKRDQFDISGTDKEHPTGIDSILLENTVNIKALNYNNFTITSIVPLDVPADAVTVTPNNGEFSITFASNFYDSVVFEVTDSNNKKSYMQIKRYTVDAYFKYTREQKPVVAAEFYFDRTKNYDDFDLTLTILYKDGTTKTASLIAQESFEDSLGQPVHNYIFDEEEAGGKGLKQAYFEYALGDNEIDTIDRMYINAEYVGNTPGVYAGAYVGSGEGVRVHVQGGE